MCSMCDGASPADVAEMNRHHIDETGWALQGVVSRRGQGEWAYTIGLAESFDHPELLMIDHDVGAAAALLNAMGAHIRDEGVTWEAGTTVDIAGVAVEVIDIHPVHLCGDALAMWHATYADRPADERPTLRAVQVRVPVRLIDSPRSMRARLDQPFARLPGS